MSDTSWWRHKSFGKIAESEPGKKIGVAGLLITERAELSAGKEDFGCYGLDCDRG